MSKKTIEYSVSKEEAKEVLIKHIVFQLNKFDVMELFDIYKNLEKNLDCGEANGDQITEIC